MKTVEIKITLDEFDSIPKTKDEIMNLFRDTRNCPLANAVKKAGICENPHVGTSTITDYGNCNIIGTIDQPFRFEEIKAILTGEIKEFITTFTFDYLVEE